MCVAVPAKILSINDDLALVDLAGTQREASLAFIEDAAVGDWVIVHAGFAIEKITEEDARQTFEMLREIMEHNEVH